MQDQGGNTQKPDEAKECAFTKPKHAEASERRTQLPPHGYPSGQENSFLCSSPKLPGEGSQIEPRWLQRIWWGQWEAPKRQTRSHQPALFPSIQMSALRQSGTVPRPGCSFSKLCCFFSYLFSLLFEGAHVCGGPSKDNYPTASRSVPEQGKTSNRTTVVTRTSVH